MGCGEAEQLVGAVRLRDLSSEHTPVAPLLDPIPGIWSSIIFVIATATVIVAPPPVHLGSGCELRFSERSDGTSHAHPATDARNGVQQPRSWGENNSPK